ncbi:FxDxF family PEP-CTERM protein [Rhodoferax mekongensis]|uniref:FxDxF family PEP-CTERM protein n=1 Tax=Rhodoferax mekongensis TaxID=3068341 RepID=A0ABZ0B2G5_9BURK|nr:FxDxF family PEP-CTERM protein [Rhodoferax sp. TBRC 17307]WNO06120.1 FxDxF family PEP-CTERM protein [Rhodoferax sp. TBRC 17307]
MKLKALTLAATAALCLAANVQAGTMNVSLNQTAPGYWQADFYSNNLTGPLLGGFVGVPGTDTISFQGNNVPWEAGQYYVELNFMEKASGSTPTIDPITVTSATLNSIPVSYIAKRSFDVDGTTQPPFILNINGYTNAPMAGYHGSISITAVPEPETYAMLLAGLGLMGAIARRRKAKNM